MKLLFSKTKIEILKKLNERNYTISELSKILGFQLFFKVVMFIYFKEY